MSNLEARCKLMTKFYNELMSTNSRLLKQSIVQRYKMTYPKLEKDIDFCFEVLAGKHKLGYTFGAVGDWGLSDMSYQFDGLSIRKFVENVLKPRGSTEYEIAEAYVSTPVSCRTFIGNLVNRVYKLGYSNHQHMVTSLSPMLAKKYPESHHEGYYYVQEKLDGNRCIAVWLEPDEMSPEGIRALKGATEGKWFYYSRSGKPLKVDFDMSWADKDYIYDGEIMTLAHVGSRDFNRTSGAINSKYGDKSGLHYFIYDILEDNLPYESRYDILKSFTERDTNVPEGVSGGYNMSVNVSILPVLDKVWVWPNPDYNGALDRWLDYIVGKGGEGVILRDPDAMYEHKRCNGLLKYKKTQTMDLRIVGWNPGKGKYEGGIGSFVCQTDDATIQVNVAGMNDDMRWSDPESWMGKIIEVAYFDTSKSSKKTSASLRFPRFKKVREDKNDTSSY